MYDLRRAILPLIAALALVAAGCGESSREPSPRVVVTIAPLAGLVGPLLPEDEEVGIVIPPGRSVHGYEPSPADRAMLERAELVVCVGLGLEGSLDGVLDAIEKRGKLIRFADVVGISADHDHDHDHGDHDHHHHAADPHLWLDPDLCMELIDAVAQRVHAAPRTEEDRQRNSEVHYQLRGSCEAMKSSYAALLEPYRGAALVTHHDAWSRLLDPLGIKVAAVIRPIEGAEPTPAELAAAQRAIERREAVGIIIEPQFDAAWPRRIAAEAGVPVAVLDPIGDGDWLAMMQSNLAELLVLFNAPGQTADLLRLDLRLDEAAGQTPPEDPQP